MESDMDSLDPLFLSWSRQCNFQTYQVGKEIKRDFRTLGLCVKDCLQPLAFPISSNWSPLGLLLVLGFPGGSDGKDSAWNAGNLGLIPGSGRSPGKGNDNLFQCSCLENPMDRGAWRATVTIHGVARIRQDWVTNTFTFRFISKPVKI